MDKNILHRSLMGGGVKERSTNINDYLTIEALEDGLTASLSTNACEYCIDGSMEWTSLAAGTATPAINTGQTLSFRATGLKPASSTGIGTFTISKKCNLSGNCMSMLFGGFANGRESLRGYDYAFYKLFYNSTTVCGVANGFLSATILGYKCYGSMFQGCTSLTAAPELPATTLATYCYSNMFQYCRRLKYIKMLATDISATNCLADWVYEVAATGTFVKNTFAQWDVVGESGVPSGWTITYPYTPQECTSLTITADDVSGKYTTTTIHWEAVTNGVNEDGSTAQGIVMSGTATSEEFPQNTSETDTVTREISFTYMGVTATTTITQGVWISSEYTIDLNSQWQESTAIANPDSATYDGVYESFSNYNLNSQYATMYIDITGYETFKLYIRSYAEGNYDYVMVSQLDKTINGNTSYSNATLVKAHTRGSQSNGTAITNYKLVEFTGIDGGDHRITIVYRKDFSGHSGLDRGYVLIHKNQ